MIGALGDVVFVVSDKTIRTFDDFERSAEGRWAKHDIHLAKPKLEFLGPELETISFSMRFDVSYGINPRKERDRLAKLARSGKAVPLVIGGKKLGDKLWVVKSVKEKWNNVDNRGNVLVSVIEVELEEYV
ncbi:phage tail protein [Carboxydothermus pertinax]|uniref:Phage tail protein n=1 Tax=Carboxydothermus pertinax TaxID=870242 RepID=A0A1L8CRU4_9THEO|nr:phage tail protein [Carboxydothermus pertinax]GAV21617.1 hypothetical protein cpu_01270 [Carboxydothermus pertinax]